MFSPSKLLILTSFQGVSFIAITLIFGTATLSAQATPLPPNSPEPSTTSKTPKTKAQLAETFVSASTLGIPVPASNHSVQSIAQSLPLPTPSQLPQTGTGTLPPAPVNNPYQQNPYQNAYPNPYQQNPYQQNPGVMPNPGYAPNYSQGYPMQGYAQPQGYVYTMPQAPTYYPQQSPYGYAPQPMGYGMPNPGMAYYPQPYAQPQPYPQQPYQPYAQQPYGVPNYGMPSYGAPGSYVAPGYAAPGYAMPNAYPNYAMPAYVSPMQAVTVLPPVAAPVMVRQFAPNFSAAPLTQPYGMGVAPLYAEAPLRSPVDKEGFLIEPGKAQQLQNQNRPLFRTTALTKPSLILQGAYVYQGGDSSARARLQGLYPLSSRVLFGATLDLSTGSFSDTPSSGFNINELYIATSLPEIPNLRFVLGQLDLTSYFDRNSFAKDGTTHFFNPIFQTNPALTETGIGSRPAALVNWSLTDNIEVKGAAFSSSRSIGDFALNGFAGEVGVRFGNAIIRGTYVTGRADENGGGFKEASSIARGGGRFGVLKGDREESFGVNAEVFIPQLKMGFFGRYGRYNNLDMNEGGDTASVGLSFLDVFARDDRLGLAYGQGLSNDARRVSAGAKRPDALELFYDFKFMPNLRMGFSIQERNSFSEIVAGFRVKTEFDLLPRGGDK